MRYQIAIISILLIPILALAQDSAKKKAYYFYGEQCPHCKKVDEYFQANGIYDKYDITKLEFSNPFNARLLLKFGEAHSSEYKGSVPAITFADKFLVGDTPIIENFEKEMENVEAKDLPDPDKIGNAGNKTDQENQASQPIKPVQNTDGKKKKYFPAAIGALIILGAGALIYVNRK
jgi:glutaredoxin-related protein